MDKNEDIKSKSAETGRITVKEYIASLGPGAIMAASIIGPGTVTTASVQGASYGFTCVWLILIACIIAYFFQEPGSRVAIGKGVDIFTGVRENMGKRMSSFLYIVILIGSIAFQAGNIMGANMALTYFFPGSSTMMWTIIISIVGFSIAWTNKYSIIENINQILIVMMVVAFVVTAVSSGPSISDFFTQGFAFKIPGGNATLALSLLATTVCPNLVLGFAIFTLEKYPNPLNRKRTIKMSNFGLGFNMVITFLITTAIVVCSATVLHPLNIKIASAGDMAGQLVPLLGRFAGVFFSLGLFAAAFSSTLYHISLHGRILPRAYGLDPDLKAKHNRLITLVIVIVPIIIIAIAGSSPVQLIITAQALNGIALPLVFIICWRLTSMKKFMGEYVNTRVQNIIFGATTLLTIVFGINAIRGVILKLIG